MEILQPTKGITWTDILTGMDVNQETVEYDLNLRNTVAPLISRQLSLSHPKMSWTTKKTSETKFIVKRIK